MPLRILKLTLAWVALAAAVNAGPTWVGPQLHFPLPARQVGNTQLGLDAGVTLTTMTNAYVGVGVDLLYHYWPASAGYKSAYDRHLMNTRFETIEGPDWALSAFQATAHVKVVPWSAGRFAPWLQAGMGVYRLDHNIVETRPSDTFAWVVSLKPENVVVEPGAYGGIGFDFLSSSHVALGLDASYHYLLSQTNDPWTDKNDMPNFSAFTIGTHMLFGWR